MLRRKYITTKGLQSVCVDIILPTYNRAHSLRNTIESVQKQFHQNWNLYICDDGSTDETVDICKRYLCDTRIHYLHLEHCGVSNARNFGLKHSGCNYTSFIDSDNSWKPEYLSLMIAFMKNFSLDSAYCAARLIEEDKSQWLGDLFDWRACYEQNYIDINCFMIKSKSINCTFDVSLKRFVDWDFILANTANIRTSYFSCALVNYCNRNTNERITNTVYATQIEHIAWVDYVQRKHFKWLKQNNNTDVRLE